MSRPIIFISNDDGVHAKGLHHLVACVKDLGEVYVVAPAQPQSGKSSAISVETPLFIETHPEYTDAHYFSVTGTPVDCVKLAMHHILPSHPAVMLSGINHGSNAGNSVIYSGTMGAVMEACMVGIPAIGYSLLHHSIAADFSECDPFIRKITAAVLADGLPHGVCLNVNFPAKVKIEGLKVVRAADSHWTEEYKDYTTPHGKPFFWLTGKLINDEPDNPDTDLYWLDRNYASVVPCHPDQSDIEAIPVLKSMLQVQ